MARQKNSARGRLAVGALIVALLACILSALLAAVKSIGGLGISPLPDAAGLDRAVYISLAMVVVGLASYAMIKPRSAREFLAGRQARHGSNALVMSLAFAGIVVVVNYLATTYPMSLDVTEDQSHTLAPETIQALTKLPDRISAVAFFTGPNDSATQLLSDFAASSNGNFEYRFVNPDLDPVAAREAGITGEGNILLLMGDRKEIASFASETELTRALIRLIRPGARSIYFLTGHGEPGLAAGGQAGMSSARSTLESKNYTVSELSLLSTNEIPADALAIVVAGPQKPVSGQETTLLREYVAAGGALVVLEDPRDFTEFGDESDPLATYLASTWGITLQDDLIVDPSSQNPLLAISAAAETHPITQNITYIVILPQARSLQVRAVEGVTQTPLILTSTQAWGETQYASADPGLLPPFDQLEDHAGPLNMAVAAENTETRGRVVVFGNSVFATDEAFNAYGNANIFVNSVDWAAEEESLISITPRQPIARTFVPPSSAQLIGIILGSLILLPGLVLAAGIYAWISRRRRG
jgi:ABC-type uncharacterized transport system involved in gliding motility auxiliary subunit